MKPKRFRHRCLAIGLWTLGVSTVMVFVPPQWYTSIHDGTDEAITRLMWLAALFGLFLTAVMFHLARD